LNLTESIRYIYPEIILFVFSLIILILGLFFRKSNLWGIFSLVGIALAGLFLAKSSSVGGQIFSGLLVNDAFSGFFKGLFLLIALIVVLISMGYKSIAEENAPEYYFLILITTICMMFTISSANFIMIYVALEGVSLTSYILVGFLKRDILSNEAALKYFLFGTLATGIMLYGISFIYGLFGTTDISIVHSLLANPAANNPVLTIALLLIFSGIAFKCAFFPFHMWAPDVYQGAPTSVSAFISVGPKAVGFVILLRVFMNYGFPLFVPWANFFTIVSIATMTIGNIIAITQTNIKRMLAYSSIAQAGYILIGLISGTALGIKAVLFYILIYAFMNLGAFGCAILIGNSIKSDRIEDYAGLYKKDPISAFLLAVFLLSLAGIPPLAGFVGKFLLFAAAIDSRLIFLVIIAAINSVVAFYYYMYLIKCMYLDEPRILNTKPRSVALTVALAIALIGIFMAGIWPRPFLNLLSILINQQGIL
jgi:NADH-quinone oxidoreductase subunit N